MRHDKFAWDEEKYDDEGINYDDIPEITDFSKGRKTPFAGKFKDGYTVIIEREGYNEVRNYDFTKIPRPTNGIPIPAEVIIVKNEQENKETAVS